MIYSYEEYTKKEKELAYFKNKMLDLMTEWIKHDPEVIGLQNYSDEMNNFECIDFYYDGQRYDAYLLQYAIRSSTNTRRTFTTVIYKKQYQDFLEFSKDPELYKSSKKYNL